MVDLAVMVEAVTLRPELTDGASLRASLLPRRRIAKFGKCPRFQLSEDRAVVRRVAHFGAARKVAALMRRPSSNVIRRDEVVRIHLDRLQELVEARRPSVQHAMQARQAQGSHSSSQYYLR